jgi:choline dehydrogenase
MVKNEADYVIVGGGSAGCILAARLSEDPSVRVDLIEAGGEDRSVWINIPAGWGKLMASGRYYWNYLTEPEPELKKRSLTWPRGKVIGGSGAVNGLVYLRGAPIDYDGWEEDGARGWSWNDVVPYYRRLEDWAGEPGLTRGKGGPIPISQSNWTSRGAAAFLDSCRTLGFQMHRDVNDGEIEGVSKIQSNIRNGFRVSSSQGYLRQARNRPNLRVVTNAIAQKLVIEGKRATGVVIKRKGSNTEEIFSARREVLLCGGVIGSAQLLMLSGIGDLAQLRSLGIDGAMHSPGVGRNLQDHVMARFRFRSQPVDSLNEVMNNPLRLGLTALRYAFLRNGQLAGGPSEATLFTKSSSSEPEADVQVQFVNFCTSDLPGFKLPEHPGFTITFDQCRPESRGHIAIQSRDPLVAPKIFANYLATDRDRRTMLFAAKLARKIARTGALGRLVEEEISPSRDVQSDAELMEFLRNGANTVYHPCGTCRMGEDEHAVVDSELKVHGISGLRVVDASVMPRILSGNIHAGALVIAEKAADLIRGDQRAKKVLQDVVPLPAHKQSETKEKAPF